ncbi:MAG: hypothetical protein AAF602_20340 [Myxococcota bacterium]
MSLEAIAIETLVAAARDADATTVGIVGFSGDWSQNHRPDAESVTRTAIEGLLNWRVTRTPRLWCVSGATDYGVPAVAYEVAERLGILRIGVTAHEALEYDLARLDHLTVVGLRFGDESEAFVELCDEIWMFGGGSQSRDEVCRASALGKSVVVVRGIGGTADAIDPAELPGARFLDIDHLDLDRHSGSRS